MIQIDNIQFRNLEEQVLKNTELLNMLPTGITGTNFKGIFTKKEDVNIEDKEFALVGSAAPYTLYFNQDGTLHNLGNFPATGPQGPKGAKGDQGEQGENAEILTGGSAPELEAKIGTVYFNFSNGDVYVYETRKWVLKGNIRGP